MKLSENFTMREFTKSTTAQRNGIDNTPQDEHLDNAIASVSYTHLTLPTTPYV